MWSLEYKVKVWNCLCESGVRIVECGVWCEVWSSVCKVRSDDCRVWSVKFAVEPMEGRVWTRKCGVGSGM